MDFVRRYSGPQEHAPWSFERVRVHRFIVPAIEAKLQAVCDLILNYKDVSFAPFTPFVTIDVLEYPTMRPSRPKGYPNPGCGMSQRELALHITLRATDAHGADIGLFDFCPFIYVDNAWSVILGREALGYPKLLADFAFESGGAGGDPKAMELTTQVCTDGNSEWSPEPILRTEYSQFYPTAAEDAKALEEPAQWEVVLERAAKLRITLEDPMLREANRQMRALMSQAGVGSVQLKEFLDPVDRAGDVHLACYKALVRGAMRNVHIRDTSGSVRPVTIKFYEYPEYEIGKFLGILTLDDYVVVPLWFRIYFDFEGDIVGYL